MAQVQAIKDVFYSAASRHCSRWRQPHSAGFLRLGQRSHNSWRAPNRDPAGDFAGSSVRRIIVRHLPNAIRLRDHGLLRHVPFFELWATDCTDGQSRPLTLALLQQLGGSLDSVEYSITMANRKAQRRTGSAAWAFIARTTISVSDHERKQRARAAHGVTLVASTAR